MECLFSFVVLLFLLVALVRSQSDGESRAVRRRSYQLLAARFQGVYDPGGLFRKPAIRFRYGETIAVLSESRATSGERSMQVQFWCPHSVPRIEIRTRENTPQPPALSRVAEFPSQDAEFNGRFVIFGENRHAVQQFLSDGVRWQLKRLADLSGGRLELLVAYGRMYVRKPQLIRKYVDLERFVGLCLALHDQAALTQAAGIEFIEPREAQTLDDALCKICGGKIESDLVYCRRCKTPHHGECWQYAGVCSVYGCRERQCLRPRTGAPLPASPSPPVD